MGRVEDRASEIVGQLTLTEKLGQMSYNAPAIPRLGITAYNWWNEALHGVARAGVATVFPQAIGMAATFDPQLLQEVAEAITAEARAKYRAVLDAHGATGQYQGLTFWTPNVNIFRDPRWGRGQETYGEDPFLAGSLGGGLVRGLQGDSNPTSDLPMPAAACAKHFAVHSGPEAQRHVFDARPTTRDLWETYLPAFERLVDEGVEAVMGAYNRVNGEPACGSPTLLATILREKWGFKGHVVSDCWAIRDFHETHEVTTSPVESSALAINSGCDLNCGDMFQYAHAAWEQGLITTERIDEAVHRLMATRIRLGTIPADTGDEPFVRGEENVAVIASDKHAELARIVAERSIVLLKNAGGVLPLELPHVKKLYVTGPLAADVDALMGNYYGLAPRLSTFLEGIAGRAGYRTKVEYRPGCLVDRPNENDAQWATFEASDADVTVVFLGNHPFLEGEEGDAISSSEKGDRRQVDLPLHQREYLRALHQQGNRVVLVLVGGSAFAMEELEPLADAIVLAWYPGQGGGEAMARILFGDVAPSGKLPVSLPRRSDDLPPFDDYRMSGRTYRFTDTFLYPFGFGLGYSPVEILEATTRSDRVALALAKEGRSQNGSPARWHVPSYLLSYRGGAARSGQEVDLTGIPGNALTLDVTVRNTGTCRQRETIQAYAHYLDDPEAPRAQLCGFVPVEIAAGEQVDIEVKLDAKALMLVDSDGVRYLPSGRVLIVVGTASPGAEHVGAAQPRAGLFSFVGAT